VNVPSFDFLVLAVFGAVAFNLSKADWWRVGVLLVINLFFIRTFAGNSVLLLPYVGFLTLGYVGIVLRRSGARWAVWALPLTVFLAFVWLKKYLFIPHALMLHTAYLTVGLSYVFFRVMHLVIDGWEDVPRGPRGILSYVNYTLNFTSLISGPIQRYEDYHSFETRPAGLDVFVLGYSLERIVVGFFKVYVVSSLLKTAHDHAISALMSVSDLRTQVWQMALVIGIYPLYLFFNFSGYTDFVIGCARLFRIELPENFRSPFSSVNFIDFWSRWHISLSQWLKDYVYSPLLLSAMRRATSPHLFPLLAVGAYFCTFFLVGAWHGQTSEFLFFGLLQGGGVAANKLYQEVMAARLGDSTYARLSANPLYVAVCRGLTFAWFAFTLVWFWSTWSTMAGALAHAAGPVAPLALGLIVVLATLVMGLAAVLAQAAPMTRPIKQALTSRYARTAYSTAMAAVILASIFIVAAPAPELVYKAF
jgi:D-alanyl-lipoteichoic acid acyltransferase DltB (MBOAT superfamily)